MKCFTGRLWKKTGLSAITLKVYVYGALTAPIASYRMGAAPPPSLQYRPSPLHAQCAPCIITSANTGKTSPALLHTGKDGGVGEVLV